MKLHKVLLIALATFLATEFVLSVDSLAAEKTGTEVLTVTLAGLNLANPIADLDANLKKQDKRFIGINGYTCTAPGISDADWEFLRSGTYGLNCLPGTGDVIESDNHKALIAKAQTYAKKYNLELLRRIRAGLL